MDKKMYWPLILISNVVESYLLLVLIVSFCFCFMDWRKLLID